ncbi:hypothetical protein AGMMS4956_16850 [Bacteroidia bacterium]|nr:hypothetical protein AGMMS4956_16850 [Bacteroidia bacterium]
MFESLKNILLKRSIRRRNRNLLRNKKIQSFDTARSIGVLFYVEEGDIPQDVKNFLTFLRQKRILYFALGYYNNRDIPANLYVTNKVVVFDKTELNWYGKPESDRVEAFLAENYDIVIDLHRKSFVKSLHYAASCVNTSLLVGGHLYENCPYDLIIDAQQIANTTQYIEEVKRYLSMLSPDKKS